MEHVVGNRGLYPQFYRFPAGFPHCAGWLLKTHLKNMLVMGEHHPSPNIMENKNMFLFNHQPENVHLSGLSSYVSMNL